MPGLRDKDHWGGVWTEFKLEVLENYLQAYTTALQKQPSPRKPFKLRYIDAFAGSGSINVARTTTEGVRQRDKVVGSALRALSVDPPFSRLDFVEQNAARASELRAACELKYPGRNIHVHVEDANRRILSICESTDWNETRAVLFIDPYGMQFDYETLCRVAQTEAIDVWYLFPTYAVSRQLAKNFDAVDSHKQKALKRLLGDDSWEDLYKQPGQRGLFGEDPKTRDSGIDQIELHAR